MMYDWDGHGWGIGAWVGIAVLIFWGAVVIVVIVLLARRARPRESADELRPPHYDAERILTKRFARGEIDEQEFTARRTVLRRQE